MKLVNLQGKLKSSRKQPAELKFDYNIMAIGEDKYTRSLTSANSRFVRSVCLTDSVLAFHKNGMQGRSFKNNEIVQEINDDSRIFRMLGSDRYVVFAACDAHANFTCVCSHAEW